MGGIGISLSNETLFTNNDILENISENDVGGVSIEMSYKTTLKNVNIF